MIKLFVATLATLFSFFAQADIINCYFTEPFISSEYSMVQQTLTYTDAFGSDDGQASTSVTKNVSFQIKAAGVFELVDKDGKVLQTLKLNDQGSDGMSDLIYPYEAQDRGVHKSANGGYGGCESNFLKATDPNK
jgi:hypothetical protein